MQVWDDDERAKFYVHDADELIALVQALCETYGPQEDAARGDEKAK